MQGCCAHTAPPLWAEAASVLAQGPAAASPVPRTGLGENTVITRAWTAQFCKLLFFLVALSPSVSNSRAMNIQKKNVLKIGDIFRIGSH